MPRTPFRRWSAIAALAVLLASVAWWFLLRGPSAGDLLSQARDAFVAADYARAESLARAVPAAAPESPEALLLAARAAVARERFEPAVAYLRRVPDDGRREAVAAHAMAGNLLLRRLHRIGEAERHFRRALAHDPDHFAANDGMVYLLQLEGRRREAVPHLLRLICSDHPFYVDLLLFLGDTEASFEVERQAEAYVAASPEDAAPLLGLARMAAAENDLDRAVQLTRRVIEAEPQLIEAHARLGRLLLEAATHPGTPLPSRERGGGEGVSSGSGVDLAQWEAALPDGADEHPDVWFVRAGWAQLTEDLPGAVRSLWEALRRDPDHLAANYQLGQLLTSLGDEQRAAPFLDRAAKLQELTTALILLQNDQQNPSLMLEAARLTESLGRHWEAWGWYRAALRVRPNLAAAQRGIERAATMLPEIPRARRTNPSDPALNAGLSSLDPPLERTGDEFNPALAVDLSDYSLFRPSTDAVATAAPSPSANPPVQFADLAREAGIHFTYFNGGDPNTRGARMFEFTGGGVAVLDYDGDGWPDLYFTQGCPWPPDGVQAERAPSEGWSDRLFRNLGDGRFADVTEQAGLGDASFSQGVAAGDFDNDGHADLYVANIGRNRLYRNSGDGTFRDVTEAAGLTAAQWTTSCAIADLSGDGLPDIYDVNYVTGPDVFERICAPDGVPVVCSPNVFEPEHSRVYVNLGDGRFVDVSAEAGVASVRGNGLGIVVADFDGSGRLNVFVANDGTPNFYFVNESEGHAPGGDDPPPLRGPPSSVPEMRFAERGLARGLALDAEGLALACMGIAAGDAGGDGRLDLFVTNYYNELNTLYEQTEGGFFLDTTRRAGLRDPSYALLGFGTQFLDGDLDGRLDLVVANGHVDDFSHKGAPYQMPPQYFHNAGNFREHSAPLGAARRVAPPQHDRTASYSQVRPGSRGSGRREGVRFLELPAEQLGPYFQGRWLGRGLARLDWNRDGLDDFAVSHLDVPAALVTNRTPSPGGYVALRLVGVIGQRDAIGTIVTATIRSPASHPAERASVSSSSTTGDDPPAPLHLIRQLTAGDGYMASNERRLVFGMGDAETIDRLTIRWPAGREQTVLHVPAGTEWLVIEGRDAVRLR